MYLRHAEYSIVRERAKSTSLANAASGRADDSKINADDPDSAPDFDDYYDNDGVMNGSAEDADAYDHDELKAHGSVVGIDDHDDDNVMDGSVVGDDNHDVIDGSVVDIDGNDAMGRSDESSAAEDAKQAQIEHANSLHEQMSTFLVPWAPDTETTILDFLVVFFTNANDTSMNDTVRERTYKMFRVLVPNNKLPKWSVAKAVNTQQSLAKWSVLHACAGCSLVFTNADSRIDEKGERQFADLDKCPMCIDEPRYKVLPGNIKVPRSVVYVFDVLSAAVGLWSRPNLASHLELKRENMVATLHEPVTDCQDSPRWRAKILDDRSFMKEPRNMVFNLGTDGVPLHGNHSCWVGILQVDNLPVGLRHQWANKILAFLIPGPSKPKSLQPCLDVLADQILIGYRYGVDAVDVRKPVANPNRSFLMRTQLSRVIADTPGGNNVRGTMESSVHSDFHIRGIWAHHISRNTYGGYRRFLKEDDARRVDPKYGPEEHRVVQMKTHEWYEQQYIELDEIIAQEPLVNGERGPLWEAFSHATGIKEKCALARLPRYDVVRDVTADGMHCVSGLIGRHLVPLFKGKRLPRKSRKQTTEEGKKLEAAAMARARARVRSNDRRSSDEESDEESNEPEEPESGDSERKGHAADDLEVAEVEGYYVNRVGDVRSGADDVVELAPLGSGDGLDGTLSERHKSEVARHQMWKVSKAKQRMIDNRFKSLQLPSSWHVSATHLPMQRTGTLKCREWQTVMDSLVEYLFYEAWTGEEKEVFFEFVKLLCDTMSSLIAKKQNVTDIYGFHFRQVVDVLVEYERLIPQTEHAWIVLQFVKLAIDVGAWGNGTQISMLSTERDMGKMVRIVHSKKHPEASIARYYRQSVGSRTLVRMIAAIDARNGASTLETRLAQENNGSGSDLRAIFKPIQVHTDSYVAQPEGQWIAPELRDPRAQQVVEFPPLISKQGTETGSSGRYKEYKLDVLPWDDKTFVKSLSWYLNKEVLINAWWKLKNMLRDDRELRKRVDDVLVPAAGDSWFPRMVDLLCTDGKSTISRKLTDAQHNLLVGATLPTMGIKFFRGVRVGGHVRGCVTGPNRVAKSHVPFFELDVDVLDTYFYGSVARAVGAQNARQRHVGKILYFARVDVGGFGLLNDNEGNVNSNSKRFAFIARVHVYKPCDPSNRYYKATGLEILDLRHRYQTLNWLDARHIGRPVVTGQHWNPNFGHQLVIFEDKEL
jgi:hypothetical protein